MINIIIIILYQRELFGQVALSGGAVAIVLDEAGERQLLRAANACNEKSRQ